MVKLLTTLMCVGILSVSASAANWVDLGKSKDKELQLFIDIDSIKPYKINSYSRDNYVSAFVQNTYINNHQFRKKGLYYAKVLKVADCNTGSLGEVAGINYGFKNEIIDSYQDKYFTASKLNIVFPETMGEAILEYMCY